mmetsp:Transcript_33932/g.97708  ORF Transcript_33932/g.97708 Transcript_33932/m.97708 type:complete len:228 (-) Transcript_33932:302-985(-)
MHSPAVALRLKYREGVDDLLGPALQHGEPHDEGPDVLNRTESRLEVLRRHLLCVHAALQEEAGRRPRALAREHGSQVAVGRSLQRRQRLAHLAQNPTSPTSCALRGQVVPEIEGVLHVPLLLLHRGVQIELRHGFLLAESGPDADSATTPIEVLAIEGKEAAEQLLGGLPVRRFGYEVDLVPELAIPRYLAAPAAIANYSRVAALNRQILQVRHHRRARMHQVVDRE